MSASEPHTSGQSHERPDQSNERTGQLCDLCEKAVGLRPRSGVPSAALTTFYIGGPLRYFLEPRSAEELSRLVRFLVEHGEAYRVLGGGSNLLISDAPLDCWIIRPGREFRYTKELGENRFEVGAAMALMSLSREMSQRGLAGLEFAGGIPASLGGATRMNAGAHGGQLSDVLERIQYVTPAGEIRDVPRDALPFAYRRSGLPEGAIVTSVQIRLETAAVEECIARRNHFLNERKKAQPLSSPSAGSVFKNPSPEQSAGRLIEAAGLKGRRIGGAMISEKHGNWIVNVDRRAATRDVLDLIELCRKTVSEKNGIELETEVIHWS